MRNLEGRALSCHGLRTKENATAASLQRRCVSEDRLDELPREKISIGKCSVPLLSR
jgi:hypothetical protein